MDKRFSTPEKLEARLLSRRRITAGGCWEWTASRFPDGYGQVSYKDWPYRVHRVAAALWLGFREGLLKSTDGLTADMSIVLHTCDNPICFNPAHLRVGTMRENIEDRDAKGRHVKGWRRIRIEGHWRFVPQ